MVTGPSISGTVRYGRLLRYRLLAIPEFPHHRPALLSTPIRTGPTTTQGFETPSRALTLGTDIPVHLGILWRIQLGRTLLSISISLTTTTIGLLSLAVTATGHPPRSHTLAGTTQLGTVNQDNIKLWHTLVLLLPGDSTHAGAVTKAFNLPMAPAPSLNLKVTPRLVSMVAILLSPAMVTCHRHKLRATTTPRTELPAYHRNLQPQQAIPT